MPALIISLLVAAAAAPDRPIEVTGHSWAPFISPMGEPFRSRSADDNAFGRWFGGADRNRDGALTPDEMQADAERFFATLDDNHDGKIDSEELIAYEAEIAPEIQVNTRWWSGPGQPQSTARGRRGGDQHDGYLPHGLQGAARYALLNLPEPVIAADADFDRAVTLAEFREAAVRRFQLLDDARQGRLTLQALQARLPTRPGRRQKAERKDVPDTRIGLPLPEGD
jgi:hypothetical protein